MKKTGLLAVAVLAVVLFAAVPASAACTDMINDLKAKTSSATYKNQKDLDGLLSKLDSAITKLDLNKPADAIQKLTDYRNKVSALISQNKISPSADGTVTPQDLLDGADAAIACIQGLMTT